MWQFMAQREEVFTNSNKEGVDRVLKEDGQYAFMMESTVVDYVVERECRLTQVCCTPVLVTRHHLRPGGRPAG